MRKAKRSSHDFDETLSLINKYKAVETTLKKAEFFVNFSWDSFHKFIR